MSLDARAAVRTATARLAAAGIASPRADATTLLGHVLGTDPSRTAHVLVLGRALTRGERTRYDELVGRRELRVPLQHLTGRVAFRRLELAVGPGVFVPRPETEGAVDLVLSELAAGAAEHERHAPVVVDLCAGSGAIALAVKEEWPGARVCGVELSAAALGYAEENARSLDLDVTFIHADATLDGGSTLLSDVAGAVDVVVTNPPYIPTGAVPRDPEVRDHDPAEALFGGSEDGLAVPLAVATTAARLLRPRGLLVVEHADCQGESLPLALVGQGCWEDVEDHPDLAGRPRHATARRSRHPAPANRPISLHV